MFSRARPCRECGGFFDAVGGGGRGEPGRVGEGHCIEGHCCGGVYHEDVAGVVVVLVCVFGVDGDVGMRERGMDHNRARTLQSNDDTF